MTVKAVVSHIGLGTLVPSVQVLVASVDNLIPSLEPEHLISFSRKEIRLIIN